MAGGLQDDPAMEVGRRAQHQLPGKRLLRRTVLLPAESQVLLDRSTHLPAQLGHRGAVEGDDVVRVDHGPVKRAGIGLEIEDTDKAFVTRS